MDFELEMFNNNRYVRNRRQRRTFKVRINMEEQYFTDRFRLSYLQVLNLVQIIGNFLNHQTQRNHALSAFQQVAIALRFFAEGASLRLIGDAHGVSKATVSRCIHRVVTILNEHFFAEKINFPDDVYNNPGKFQRVTNSRMPNVCGVIDGTHVNIATPTVNEAQFVNRHDNHSINVMLVCGP